MSQPLPAPSKEPSCMRYSAPAEVPADFIQTPCPPDATWRLGVGCNYKSHGWTWRYPQTTTILFPQKTYPNENIALSLSLCWIKNARLSFKFAIMFMCILLPNEHRQHSHVFCSETLVFKQLNNVIDGSKSLRLILSVYKGSTKIYDTSQFKVWWYVNIFWSLQATGSFNLQASSVRRVHKLSRNFGRI